MDQEYWDQYYSGVLADIQAPSSFAERCMQKLSPGHTLFELGCGNGRDALFFARSGLRVIGCDQSGVAIKALTELHTNGEYRYHPRFVQGDFSSLTEAFVNQLDAVYARFTLHAVPKGVASSALLWTFANLKPGGQFFVEARTVKGSLYGKGEPKGSDAFVHDGHYRRFLRAEDLTSELSSLGFVIADQVESAGLAIYNDDDPVVVRVIATKP